MAADAYLAKEGPRYWEVDVAVGAREVVEKRARRGRPKKDEPPPHKRTVNNLSLTLSHSRDDVIEDEVAHRPHFILITNDRTMTEQALLEAYRGQQSVENEFRWLKAPFHVSPIFLRKAERVTAFGYVALIYLVYALIQHAVRSAMDPGERLQIEGRKTDRPTGTAVLDVLRHIRFTQLTLKNGLIRRFLNTVHPYEARILTLLGVEADAVRHHSTHAPVIVCSSRFGW